MSLNDIESYKFESDIDAQSVDRASVKSVVGTPGL